MNKTAIKNYAIWARVQLIEAAKQRAFEYEITADGENDPNLEIVGGRILSQSEIYQRQELISLINRKGYDQVMEEAAYTWFNRFIALRFMEVNGYLPSKVRVFSNENGEFKPEVLKEAMSIDLIGIDKEKIVAYLEKQDNEDLYKYLLISQCNDLSNVLPYMFERIDNWTEMLFPANLLRQDGVIGQMISEIPAEDWTDAVQIIGWLYQYYNSELKDDTFAKLKKNVKISKERIPAATQLFTPDWIVRYMVENSLGRLWYEGHPDFDKTGWKYYLDEAEQGPEVEEQLKKIRQGYADIKPEEIKIIDPCMGSGHILVYAFDLLMQIYTSCGWSERDAAKSILENNLYGLDIDDRAGQIAYFAVMMKARKYSRRILNEGIRPKVLSIQESNVVDIDMRRLGDEAVFAQKLLDDFKDAKEYGSILKLSVTEDELDALEERLKDIDEWAGYGNLTDAYESELLINSLGPFIQVARILIQKYDGVITNPPYMGGGGMSVKLGNFVKKNYPDSKNDMSTVFMEQCLKLTKDIGFLSMINIPAWMFLSSFERLRTCLLTNNTIINMVHPGRGIFGSDFGTIAFVIGKQRINGYKGHYRRLFDVQGEVKGIEEREQQMLSGKGCFFAQQDSYSRIPGSPIAYWVSYQFINSFNNKRISDYGDARLGMATADNNRFLRLWFELMIESIGFHISSREDAVDSKKKWFPHNKGGDYRKWYGNNAYVVNWHNDGEAIQSFIDVKTGRVRSHNYNLDYIFREGITWTFLSASKFAARFFEQGFLCDATGCGLYVEADMILYIEAVLCSKIAEMTLNVLNPTISYQPGNISAVPIVVAKKERVDELSIECINISKSDWDAFETSWDFKKHPLV